MFEMISKKINNRKGFTLIELIVVIAIIGILAAIAIPRLGGFTDTAKERAAEANEKLVNNMISVYYADEGDYPTSTTFTLLMGELQTKGYIDDATETDLTTVANAPDNWNNAALPTYSAGDETITMP